VRKRLTRLTRRSFVGVLVGLAFAAAAGVGLAQITVGSSESQQATSTTESQTTSTGNTTTGDREGQSADDQESESEDGDSQGHHQTSTTLSTTTLSSTSTATTGDESGGGDFAGGQEKQDVCHVTGNGGEHTINIAAPAVPAHMAHGDTLGACAGDSASSTTSTSASTTTTSSHGHEPLKPKKAPQRVTSHASGNSPSTSHGNSGHSSVKTTSHRHAGKSHKGGGSTHGGGGSSHAGGGNGHGK
jgi:hypothetical protein